MPLMDKRTVKLYRYSSSRSEDKPVQTTDVVSSDALIKSQRPIPRSHPMTLLLSFLTYDSSSTTRHTANSIRDLYLTAKSRKRKLRLASEQLSDLIALFGSLSIDTPHSLRSSLVNGGSVRPYWAFLKKLVEDKIKLGHELVPSDHYWLVRFHLSRLDEKDNSTAIQDAKKHYNFLGHEKNLHDLRVAYTEALLTSGTMEDLSEAIDVVLEMLCSSTLDPPQMSCIWKLIQNSGLSRSPDLQSKIIGELQARFEKVYQGIGGYVEDDPEHGEPTVLDLVSLFASAIFTSDPKPLRFQSLLPWSVRETRAALLSVSKISAWRNFCLLALSHSVHNHHIRLQPVDAVNESNISDWKIICVLAVLDSTLGRLRGFEIPHHLTDSAVKILVSVWDLWVIPSPPGRYRPVVVDRAIATVFLRLAGIIRDRSLQMSCHHYGVTRGFWYYGSSTVLAVEYAMVSISCDELDWDTSFPNVGGPELESEVVQKTILSSMAVYPESAHELYLDASSRNTVLSAATIAALGVVVAKTDPNLAIPYLSDSRLSSKDIQAILSSAVWSPSIVYGSPELFLAVGDSMLFVYVDFIPPMSIRNKIEAVLFSMMRLSKMTALKAVSVFQLMRQRVPGYLEEAFVWRALRTLIFHRFFSVATHLNTLAGRMYPKFANRWHEMLVVGLARGRARFLGRQAVRSYVSPGRRLRVSLVSLVEATKLDVHHPNRLAAVKMLSMVRRDPAVRPRVLGYAIQLLARSRCISAAKKLYEEYKMRFNKRSRTYFGNSILHASLYTRRRRNLARVMKLIRTLTELRTELGFVPDRVTVNIVIKGILMWTNEVDSEQLRALFNNLILNGYPGGTVDEQRKYILPFPVTKPMMPFVLSLEQVKDQKIMWKHVRPLYRMFVKAFRLRGDREAVWIVVRILKELYRR